MTRISLLGGLRISAVFLGAALCGCSGSSSGSSAPPADMGGHWLFYMTPPGGGTETGPNAVLLTQTGGSLDGAGMSGTISGNNFTMTADAVIFTLSMRGTVEGDTGSGELEIVGFTGMTGSFRLQRFRPTGTMTATGSIQGQTISIDSSTAIGSRDYLDVGLTQLDEVEIMAMQDDMHLEIDFDAAGVAVGTRGVPVDVTAGVTYRGDAFSIEVDATGGSVEVLQYDATGFAGTFTLDLPGGDSVTGSFQVEFDFDSYDA